MENNKGDEKRICFVIAPVGDPDSPIRKRSDQILKHVITPAVTRFGYDALRADKLPKPGMITSQIIQHIIDDPLVIADLTEKNPNVYYELAVRHAIKKPFIQIINRGESIPFDLAGMRTILVDLTDPDSVEQAREDVAKQVEWIERDPNAIESPISVAVQLETLLQSGKPLDRSLGAILASLSDMRTELAEIRKAIGPRDVDEWRFLQATKGDTGAPGWREPFLSEAPRQAKGDTGTPGWHKAFLSGAPGAPKPNVGGTSEPNERATDGE